MTVEPLFLPHNGAIPRVHPTAYIAPGAVIIGDVAIGAESSVFYGSVLRGDVGPIRIGRRTNIQDNSVIHVDTGGECVLGDDITVGHMALIHSATVGDGTLVGMKSALLSRSTVGRGCLIAAGAVVLERATIPDATLAAGIPAKPRRQLSQVERDGLITHAGAYVTTAADQADLQDRLGWADVVQK